MFGSSSRTTIQNKHQNKHKHGSLSTKWIFYHGRPSPLTWTLQNEWGELKRRSTNMELWIWRIWRDSVWRKWSLISYQVFSKLFRHYSRKLRAVTLGKGRCNNCGQHELEKAFISQWDFPPTFNCFTSMIGWDRINNADLFSQPPLLIFTKGANISGGQNSVQENAFTYVTTWFVVYNMCENITHLNKLQQGS